MNERTHTTILDGQQRLATATILFSIIRDIAAGIGGTKGLNVARDTQKDLISKIEDDGTFSLNLGELDSAFFRASIQHFPVRRATATLRSHKLIAGARAFLFDAVTAHIEGKSAEKKLAELRRLRNTVSTDLAMVAIQVVTEDDAYHIFETLNDRGLRLSVPDLLLNFLMRRGSNRKERVQVREAWNQLLEQMGKRDVDRFLRHMWVSIYGDIKARSLFREIKENLDGKHIPSVDFAEQCLVECESYMNLVDSDVIALGKSAASHVRGCIDYLQSPSTIPLLLAGIRCMTPKNFEKLAKSTVALVIRHAVVGNLNPNALETVLFESAREVRSLHEKNATDSKIRQEVRKRMQSIDPDDADVHRNFQNLILGRAQAQYLVGTIAQKMQSNTHEIVIGDGTLEHIFPQSPDAGWANISKLKEYIWHVGNLTILGTKLNGKSANDVYKKKVPHYRKSEITMTKKIPQSYKKWDEAEILRRAAELAAIATQIWVV
jgi:hypothetical protein